MIRPTLALCCCLLLAACGSSVPKVFPGGDIFDHRPPEGVDEFAATETVANPTQRIRLTRKTSDRGLDLSFKLQDERVKAGQPFVVEPRVFNRNDGLVPITYASEKRFDMVVFRDETQREPVYMWSEGRYFADRFQETFLGGRAPLMRTLEIPTMSSEARNMLRAQRSERQLDEPLGPGVYYLWVTHEGDPYLATGPQRIEVQP